MAGAEVGKELRATNLVNISDTLARMRKVKRYNYCKLSWCLILSSISGSGLFFIIHISISAGYAGQKYNALSIDMLIIKEKDL